MRPRSLRPTSWGTWDLESAENVPLDDVLVFARLTFTGDEVRSLLVTIDGDGALHGDRTRARYRVSNGQLIVRKLGSVTVWDVARDADRLAVHDLETDVVLRMREVPPDAGLDPELGRHLDWNAWRPPFHPPPRPGRGGRGPGRRRPRRGRAPVHRGGASGPPPGAYLVLGEDPAHYGFQRDADGRRQLVVDGGGERTVLRRLPE